MARPAPLLTFAVRGDAVVVSLYGPLDVQVVDRLDDGVVSVAALPARGVVIDLSHVDFADSHGLRALERAAATLAQHGKPLRCADPSPQLQHLLASVDQPPRLTFAPSVEAGVRGLRDAAVAALHDAALLSLPHPAPDG